MTNEEKQVLLKDLCARLPYGVKCKLSANGADISIAEKLETGGFEHFISGTLSVKPYLRPLSSMTEDEEIEFAAIGSTISTYGVHNYFCILNFDGLDWLNSHHFDYRGLIPMGLALKAPEGMYKTE